MIRRGEPADEHLEELRVDGDGGLESTEAEAIGLRYTIGRSEGMGDDVHEYRHRTP